MALAYYSGLLILLFGLVIQTTGENNKRADSRKAHYLVRNDGTGLPWS